MTTFIVYQHRAHTPFWGQSTDNRWRGGVGGCTMTVGRGFWAELLKSWARLIVYTGLKACEKEVSRM